MRLPTCVRVSSIPAIIEQQQNNERARPPRAACSVRLRRGKLRKAADKLPFSYLDKMYFSLHQTLARAEGGETRRLTIFCSIIHGVKRTGERSFSMQVILFAMR